MGNGWRHLSEDGVQFKHIISNPMVNGIFYFFGGNEMHKALYRVYRPIVFEDMIGQEHIIKTLKNQIKEGNLNHAYLFCGTRGTGKTTAAKILSRAVNCDNLENNNPCNQCESCVSILDNSNIDVVEIDAASNNSVDDIRELRETVKYTPSNSKYKVYIIDEVHMLSQGAFNALLKTLEEPPSYVIFILATTEPNKIPATILSRCQRFDFKRVSINDLMDRMRNICKSENIEIDEESLRIVARNGQGSVRDSLSILDKCVSFTDGVINASDVEDILGITDPIQLIEFARNIIEYNVGGCIKLVEEYYTNGKDLKILTLDLIQLFRNIMVAKILGDAEDFIEFTVEYKNIIIELSKAVRKEELVRVLTLLSELLDNLRFTTNSRMSMEVYMMKIAAPQTDSSMEALYSRIEKLEKLIEDGKISIINNVIADLDTQNNKMAGDRQKNFAHGVNKHQKVEQKSGTDSDSTTASDSSDAGASSSESTSVLTEEILNNIKEGWMGLMNQLNKDNKKVLRAFLLEKVDLIINNDILYIVGSENFSFVIARLRSVENIDYLKIAIKKVFGIDVNVGIILSSETDKMLDGNISNDRSSDESNGQNRLLELIGDDFSGEIEYEE